MKDEEMAEEYICNRKCQDDVKMSFVYCRTCTRLEDFLAGLKAGRDVKIMELEQQIEKMKRHCNCKHRDSEGYCEVKRTYLIDLSYDGCDKWELED